MAEARRPREERPTVSVLVCNYNHARYLPESLGAVCGQTVPPDEVIVVDDGSTDESMEVIEAFARLHPFLEVLRNETNRGVMYSIRRALEHASKSYLVWVSADDTLLPHFLERNLAVLGRYPGAGVCFSRLAVFEEGTNVVREYLGDDHTGPAFDLGREPFFLTPAELRRRLARSYLWMSGNTVLAHRGALLEAGAFRPELQWHSEWFVYYVVALRHGACVVPETLALMREVPGTYSKSGMSQPAHQRKVLKALAAAIKEPQCRDVAPVFRARPTLLSPFGGLMLEVLATNPAYWDLAWRYLQWTLSHWGAIYSGRAAGVGGLRLRLKGATLRAAARAIEAATPAGWKE